MTQRRRLDAFLVEQAAAAGADFRDGVTEEGVSAGPDGAVPTASPLKDSTEPADSLRDALWT